MSGFEVAGLVLGVVPILIEALKAYKEARTIYRYFRHKALYIDRMIGSLKDHQFLVHSDLLSVLKASGINERAIRDAEGGRWSELLNNKSVQEDVRDHLNSHVNKGYDRYIDCLRRCETSLAEIARCVTGLTDADLSSITDPSVCLHRVVSANAGLNGGYFWQRAASKLKFVMEKSDLDAKLAELDSATSMLRRLNLAATPSGTADVTPGTTSKKFDRLANALYYAGTYATLLYKALLQSAYCVCHKTHSVHLFLENTSGLLQKPKGSLSFDIELAGVSTSHGPEHLHRGKVQMLEEDDEHLMQNSGRKVVVQIDIAAPVRKKVANICQTVSDARGGHDDLILHLSPSGQLFYSKAPRLGDYSCTPLASFITLEEIIDRRVMSETQLVQWSVGKRMTLAAMLCAATIQYSTTWWFDSPWKASSIFFPRAEPATRSNGKMTLPFDPEKPFIKRDDVKQDFNSAQPFKSVLIDLGILLLELWHQQSLSKFAKDSGLTLTGKFGSRYDAARLWLDETDDLLPFYHDAITRCVEGAFATSLPEFKWEDKTLRQSVCENVLKPLFENCPQSTMRRSVHR